MMRLGLLLLVALLANVGAHAQPVWPQRTVRMVVPFAPGGATDIITRLLAEEMTRNIGQSVVVENRGGASGTIAGTYVARAPADGYTLFMGTTGTNILAPIFIRNVPYETQRDFRGVAMVAGIANLLAVTSALPVATVQELVTYARANPGVLNYAATGSGSRMAMELFLQGTGIDIVMVPFSGGGLALQAMLQNQVHVSLDLLPSLMTAVQDGQLRALAVSTLGRSARAPAVPTLAESGLANYEFISWQGIFAPRATPDAVVEAANRAVLAALAAPETRRRISELGADVMGGTAAEMDAYIAAEIRKLTAVATAAKIEPQ
ncbi:Bug family tripartite tricarboxylate transporter substrate binding protein [Humitalea sp. 24SJ18S-53]|uniref:Bug family tripartite tricarboxylate transporter substrate binding protein n=1 Tax=Humitalea sp. 24SJ18S-53 TaxID=3422307 RepID=UPI003D672F3E